MKNTTSINPDPNPQMIEAYLAREMANFALENAKLMMHEVTIRTNPGGTVNFQMATIPSIGEEIAVSHGNGREQVYRVVNVRHNAYASNSNLKYAAKAVTIWGELVQRPVW
jgi:hypothetical protein